MLINLKKDIKYKLVIDPKADKYLLKLSKKNKKDFDKLLTLIKELPIDPYNSKPLKNNEKGLRRLKKGGYRLVFKIANSTIVILDIGKRNNVYKKRWFKKSIISKKPDTDFLLLNHSLGNSQKNTPNYSKRKKKDNHSYFNGKPKIYFKGHCND